MSPLPTRRSIRAGVLAIGTALLATVLTASVASAQMPTAAVPTRDGPGTKDAPALPRFTGSVLIESSAVAFDEVVIPRATLVKQGSTRDPQNNALFADPSPIRLEGRRTRLTYLLPPGHSPLEAIRGYQQAVRTGGGQVLYECAAEACGGDAVRGTAAGGSESGLIGALYPKSEIKAPLYTPPRCVVEIYHSNQRYTALRLKSGAVAGVLAYTAADDCDRGAGWTDRTAVVVLLGEPAARQQLMTTVTAAAMPGSMASDGKVVLYALFFDTGKSDLKPESGPQLAEMGRYLKNNGGRRVLVVGHTDNQGALDGNLDLSRRRAQAVVDALVRTQGVPAARLTPQGVGMAAPVATNQTDDGRAKNRRVELVQQ